jgi:hypothetical protein
LQQLFSRYSKYKEDANEKGIAARKRGKATEDSWEVAKRLRKMDDSIDEMNKWSANIEGVMQIMEDQAQSGFGSSCSASQTEDRSRCGVSRRTQHFESMEGEEKGNGEEILLNEDLTVVATEADGSNDGPSIKSDADEENPSNRAQSSQVQSLPGWRNGLWKPGMKLRLSCREKRRWIRRCSEYD